MKLRFLWTGLAFLPFWALAWNTQLDTSWSAVMLTTILFAAGELALAVPLAFGFLSLATPFAFAAAAWPQVGLTATLGAIYAGLLLRSFRPPSRPRSTRAQEFLVDALPATAAAAASASMGMLGLPLLFLSSLLLPQVLRHHLRIQGAEFAQLARENLALTLLAPLALLVRPATPWGCLLLLPIAWVLRRQVQLASRLEHFQATRVEVRQERRGLQATAAEQAARERLLNARAEAFFMLESLSSQRLDSGQAVQEIIRSLQSRFPTASHSLVRLTEEGLQVVSQYLVDNQRPEMALLGRVLQSGQPQAAQLQGYWPLQKNLVLWIHWQHPPSSEVVQTLEVFLRYASALLDRAEFQQQLLDTLAKEVALRQELSQSAGQLAQASKLAAIGQLAAGVSHELNTPLGALTLALNAALSSVESRPERTVSRIQQSLKAVDHMQGIVSKLLYYARESGQGKRQVDLADIVNDSLRLVEHSSQGLQVQVHRGLTSAMLQADPGEIQQIVVNLLSNAYEALRQKDLPRALWLQVSQSSAWVILEVRDNGPGIDEEIAPRVFEPFFTTRAIGQGTGLGLSISRQIAEQHGGCLELVAHPEGGTCFRLKLPR